LNIFLDILNDGTPAAIQIEKAPPYLALPADNIGGRYRQLCGSLLVVDGNVGTQVGADTFLIIVTNIKVYPHKLS
jgi:hypothetical protein